MKRNFKLIGMLIFVCIFSLAGCTKRENDNVLENIDVLENLVIDRNADGTEDYKYFNNGKLEKVNFKNNKGNLRAYNEKSDTLIFLEYDDDGFYRLKIRTKNKEKSITIDGILNFVTISSDGNYTFYSTLNADNIPVFHILNNNSFESEILKQDNILISGDLISFNNKGNLIFYGINIDKKEAGVFEYDIKLKTYSLVTKIEQGIVTALEILEGNKILLFKSLDEQNYIEIISNNNLENKVIKCDFKHIENAILVNEDIYFSAFENDKLNLYKYDNIKNNIKRLTFTFPYSLGRESRLLEWNNRIYFVDVKGEIYYYDIASESTVLGDFSKGEYIFLDK
ncbi:MAG: hypothetical protein ACRC41_14290 [Sarcina sp.]